MIITGEAVRISKREVDVGAGRSAALFIFSVLFILFSFTPYTAIIPIHTDIQPYSILMALFVCMLGLPPTLPSVSWFLVAPPFVSLAIWLAQGGGSFGFRETVVYAAPLVTMIATLIILGKNGGREMFQRAIRFAAYGWLVAGLSEHLFGKEIFSFLLHAADSSKSRGVTGLATEPSFYGIYCLFLIILNFIMNGNRKDVLYLCIFQIIILAESAITVAMFIPLGILLALFYPNRTVIFSVIFASLVSIFAIIYIFPMIHGVRIVYLVDALLKHPTYLLDVDRSVNSRVGHMLFSILGFFQNFGVPHGFEKFSSYVILEAPRLGYDWIGSLDPSLKIMSGYGSAVFELGWFGLAFPLAAAIVTFEYFGRRVRAAWIFWLYLAAIMSAAVQISLPFFGILLGWLSFYAHGKPDSLTGRF